MTEKEPREAEIESLLRRSMAAPVPSLPPDFDQRLMRQVRRSSSSLDRYDRLLLSGYGLNFGGDVCGGDAWSRARMGVFYSGDDTWVTRRAADRTVGVAGKPSNNAAQSRVDLTNRAIRARHDYLSPS
jgi:hypothetical protein